MYVIDVNLREYVMGIDIVAFVEVRLEKEWQNYGLLDIERDYDLYSKMTDGTGRGFESPIALQRGFPKDCTKIVKHVITMFDCFAISYLTIHECEKLIDWCCERKDGSLWYSDLDSILKNFEEDGRLVFGFC
jgi:hypothetical protein